MEFRLTYRGPLKANGRPDAKQKIRRAIHRQLKTLWNQTPLIDFNMNPDKAEQYLIETSVTDDRSKNYIGRSVAGFKFIPLVNAKMFLIAELNIVFLRPEAPGSLITQGGDIDNRIKTLLDALRMPNNSSELPAGDKADSDEDPFYCLLEDDNLVTSLSVTTDRLLEPMADGSEVALLIHVNLKRTRATLQNLGLG